MTIEQVLNPIELYYELYPEERDMSESYWHRDLSNYLRDLLLWYYRGQACLVTANLVVYLNRKLATSPDVALIKGVSLTQAEQEHLSGWHVNPPLRPAPSVTFEISSESNWDKDVDLDKNVERYGRLGVKEYFAYDPHGYWGEPVQLKGWRYYNQQPTELTLVDGRIWSEELESYVVPGGTSLRLYDAQGNRRLTKAEFEEQRAELEMERARATIQKIEQRAEQEEQRATKALQKAESEEQRAAALQTELETLKAKLKANLINLDNLK